MTAMDRTSSTDLVARCGARKRDGDRCRNAAGKGTDHVGFGMCKLHGGSTRSGKVKAAKDMAIASAREDLKEIDITALDAADYTLRRMQGIVTFYRLMQTQHDIGSDAWLFWHDMERGGLAQHARTWKMATEAGVADRLARISERQGSEISEAFDGAVSQWAVAMGLTLSAEQLTALVVMFAEKLSPLEHDDIEGSAA